MSSFQKTGESNYVIAIASFSDWLKNLMPVFIPVRSKTTIVPCTCNFTHALSKLQVIARNFDWLIALFAPVVIGRSNYFGIGFLGVI